jgi:hypothetical protein
MNLFRTVKFQGAPSNVATIKKTANGITLEKISVLRASVH